MADTRLGKIGITVKEPWAADISFEVLDMTLNAVENGGDGCSYVALRDNIGVTPGTDPNTWVKSTQAGQSIYDLAVKYHHFAGTEEEFEAEYQAALQAARDAAAGASAVEAQVEAAETARVEAETGRADAESARQSAEASRASAETARGTAEAARQSAESGRASAETARVTAEQGRVSAESDRVSAEAARTSAEAGRVSDFSALKTDMETAIGQADAATAAAVATNNQIQTAEAGRVSAEQGRVSAENARASAESARATAETGRATAETARATAEGQRATAEGQRVTAENARVSAETGRASAESARVTAEAARQSAETAREAQASSDHTRAESDHTIVQGYDTRLTTVEGEVSQLGQEVEEPSFNFGDDWSQHIPMSLGYIVCNGAVGTIVNLTPVAHSTYKYAIVSCAPGDVFYIRGKGGNADKLYCFIDSENKVISSASASYWPDYHKLTAPANTAKIIINDETGQAISYFGEKAINNIEETIGEIPIVARCLDMQYDGDKTITMDAIYLYRYNQLFKKIYCDGDASSHSAKSFIMGSPYGALLVLDSNDNVVLRLNNSYLKKGDIVLLSYSDTLGFDGGGLLYQSLSRIKNGFINEAIDNIGEKVCSLFSGKPFDLEIGGISKTDGSEISASARRTQFIKIQPNCDLYVRTYSFGSGSSVTMLALYDSNKQFIQAELPTATQVYYTALQLKDLGAAYFRCTIVISSITNGYACIAHGSYNNLYFQARCLDLVINSQNSVTIDSVFLYSKAGMTTVYVDGNEQSHSPKTFTFGYPDGALLVLDSEEKLVQRLNNGSLLDGDIVLLSHNTTVGFDGGLLYGEYLRVKLSETPTVDVDNSQVFQSAKKIADSYGNGLTPLSIDCDASGYELPTTRQERDIQKKIEQLTSIKWTPLGAIPNLDGSGSFTPGVEYTGMPYSSVKERDKFVGFDVSLYTFMTAINNPYSLIYTENVSSAHSASAWGKTYHGVNCGTYYGVVCNVFATQCCGFKVIWNTNQHDWQSNYLFNLIRVFNQSAQGLKIGDIVWRSGHDQIVYAIKRNSDGDVIGVILAESNGLAHISSEITAQAFDNLLVTHIVYRGMELYKNKYVPSPFVAIRDEVITPFVYNDDICCFAGDKACFREGETIAINYNLKQIGAWTAMELYKNGSLLETISIDASSHVLDLTSRNLSYGKYKARLTDGTNYSDYTEFEILQTMVSKEVQGDRTKITFSSSNGTPVYFRICDISGTNKGTHEFTEKELNDGYCSIDLAKLNAEQYPSSPISGNTYIKVFFQGEFGRVTNEPLQFNP